MASIKETVTQQPDGLYTFRCPSPIDCGLDRNNPDYRWTTSGWPTAEIAQARGLQHINEHVNKEPMQDLDEFRVSQGMAPLFPVVAPVDLTAYLSEEN
jgi:hypothetical protein